MKLELPQRDVGLADDFSRSEPLRYLNLFRLTLAGLFLVAGPSLNLGSDSPTIFFGVSFAYVAAVLSLGFRMRPRSSGTTGSSPSSCWWMSPRSPSVSRRWAVS